MALFQGLYKVNKASGIMILKRRMDRGFTVHVATNDQTQFKISFKLLTSVFKSFNLFLSSNSSEDVRRIVLSVSTMVLANFRSSSCRRISDNVL
jgi:hypothetical protein